MTREEHLKFCKKCTNRKMDMHQGLICILTNKKASFEETCENFQRDVLVKDEIKLENRSTIEIVNELPIEIKSRLAPHQELVYAIIGGFFLSIICALIWAVITVATEYQIGFMAIGVGFIVGMGIRFFGAGIDPIFGLLGGFYALLGCLLGNLFSQVGFIAVEQSLGYFETLTFLDLATIILIYQESFSIMDLLFYGIAIFEGYKFAFRPIPANVSDLKDLTPEFSKLRLPLVIVCFIILSISGYTLSKGVTGEQIFYYENGSIQSRGEYLDGRENGTWIYFYENGPQQVIANYVEGIENGNWKWFYESGALMRSGNYKNGLFDEKWLSYNEKGVLIDSSNYSIGRLDGEYKSYYENGQMSQMGQYSRDRQEDKWMIFYENGILNATGSFNNGELFGLWKFNNYDGTPSQEINYLDRETVRILNIWDSKGNQLIKNGNGKFISYYDDKNKLQEGKVTDGIKVGTWTTYYIDGKIKEVGEFKEDKYIVKSAWTKQGEVMVQNGIGEYLTYFEDSNKEFEKGYFENGLRVGTWLLYYPNSIVIQLESNYKNGKLDGRTVTYFANGNISSEGNLEADKKVGEWKWYYESGQLQCSINYVNDKKQGDQIFWSETGRKAKIEVYIDDEFISETLL